MAVQYFRVLKSIKMKNIAFCFLALFIIGCNEHNYRPELTAAGIRSIKLGMNLEEVVKYIGMPYEVGTDSHIHDISCKNALQRQAVIRTYNQLNETIQIWERDT